jgi:PAS domain S-box-containing protein
MAVYPDSIAADVSSQRLNRYFINEDNTYRVKKQIREMIVFANQSLIKDPPFSRLDLVSCRNLLIYMGPVLQKKILPLFHYTLTHQGILFLGTSESIGEFSHHFSPIDKKWKIFKRKEYVIDKVGDYPRTPFYDVLPTLQGLDEKREPTVADVHKLAERIVLDNYAPPCVLINEQYEILHFIGQTDNFLAPPVGKASFSVLNMAREGVKYKLSTALHNAVKQKKTVLSTGIKIKHNNSFRTVDLVVRPLTESGFTQGFMLVMFEDKTPPEPVQEKKAAAKEIVDPYLLSLEKELQSTKEYLQTTNEELETSNEELKSTNEELQSVNEELQSTNEELETSKEELQSTNEELVTVNAELQKKVEELSKTNNDMKNLLESVDIPTIFLDNDLCIKRFTAHATKVINLIHTDIGRPIDDIVTKIEGPTITEDAKAVLEDLVSREKEVMTKDGSCYSMRILPYRTIENVIDGVVITFLDLSERKRGEAALCQAYDELDQRVKERTAELAKANKQMKKEIDERKRSEENLRLHQKIIENMAEGVYLIRAGDGLIVYTNPKFEEMFGYGSGELMGKHVSILNAPTEKTPEETAEEIIQSLKKSGIWIGEVNNIKKDGTSFWCHANVSTFNHPEYGEVWISVHEDIMQHKKAEDALRVSEEQLRLVTDALPVLIAYVDSEQRYRYNNKAYERWFGHGREEIYGKHVIDVLGDSAYQEIRAHVEKVLSGTEVTYETEVPYKVGGNRYVKGHYIPHKDEKGVVKGFFALVNDMTKQ